jgi:hypothetical protein
MGPPVDGNGQYQAGYVRIPKENETEEGTELAWICCSRPDCRKWYHVPKPVVDNLAGDQNEKVAYCDDIPGGEHRAGFKEKGEEKEMEQWFEANPNSWWWVDPAKVTGGVAAALGKTATPADTEAKKAEIVAFSGQVSHGRASCRRRRRSSK